MNKKNCFDLNKPMPVLTLPRLESRFAEKTLGIRVVCPQNGTAVLKG